jgi:hypothetical protein
MQYLHDKEMKKRKEKEEYILSFDQVVIFYTFEQINA